MSTAVQCEPIRSALPACLFENPNRLVSLLDMLKFKANSFCWASSLIGQMYAMVNRGVWPSDEGMGGLGSALGEMQRECEKLELPATIAQLERLKATGFNHSNPMAFARDVMEVQIRMMDELKARLFFAISSDHAKYFDSSQFPQTVIDRFPGITFDADEAGKCLALERPTACVYHLMRITEYGLRQIGKRLGISNERPNWQEIINRIDAELRCDYKDRKFKGLADFLASISAHLNAVKVAWRNRVMHVDSKHTPEEAREIYNATVGLMRYIAENIPAEKQGVVQAIRGIMGA